MKKKIYNEVYSEFFHLIISDDIAYVSRKYGIPFNGDGAAMLRDDGIYIVIGTGSDVGDLAHEIEHAISFLWENRGIEKIEGVDECYAYMIGWLSNKLIPLYYESKTDL